MTDHRYMTEGDRRAEAARNTSPERDAGRLEGLAMAREKAGAYVRRWATGLQPGYEDGLRDIILEIAGCLESGEHEE